MVSEADRMAGVLAPIRQQIVSLEVAHHGAVHVGAGDAGSNRVEGDLLRRDGVLEEPSHLVGWRTDDHRPLELRFIAPDRRARLCHEYVAFPELDVVRDRVRP